MAACNRKKKAKRAHDKSVHSDDPESESESEYNSEDSDVGLQKAFEKNILKPGLNYEVQAPREVINNEAALKEKLEDLQLNLDWIERLDVTCDRNTKLLGQEDDSNEVDVHDDFRREMGFYHQAQKAVLEALPKLHEMGRATKRPEDYFAEMAKTDKHMRKVREKLIAKQLSIEKSEKAKKLRELRKFGKKVQQEVLLQRQRDKKHLMESVKQYKKGNKESLDAILNNKKTGDKKGEDKAKRKGPPQKDLKKRTPSKKRQYKDKKWGMGGKRDKRNSKNSMNSMKNDDDGFNYKRNHSEVFKARGGKAFDPKAKKGMKQPMKRPGKKQRQKKSSKRRKFDN